MSTLLGRKRKVQNSMGSVVPREGKKREREHGYYNDIYFCTSFKNVCSTYFLTYCFFSNG